jgi:molybdopterin synthase sulfur carrier subunit
MQIGFYATLRPIVGAKKIELELRDGNTVQDLIDQLMRRFPDLEPVMLDESGALSRKIHIFIEGRSVIYLADGLATKLDSGLRIDIFPAIAGG